MKAAGENLITNQLTIRQFRENEWLDDCGRVTVGTAVEIDKLIDALKNDKDVFK